MVPLLIAALAASPVLVTPNGNDGAPRPPFASLPRALRYLRENPSVPKRIEVAPGDYSVNSSIQIGAADGAVRIVAKDPKRPPHILGGTVLNRWRAASPAFLQRLPPEARTHVLECDLRAAGIAEAASMSRRGFGANKSPMASELSFRGKPLTLAQYPNPGSWLRMKEVSADGFTFAEPRTANWAPNPDLWVHGYWNYDWADTYEQVAEMGPDRLKTVAPHGQYGYQPGRRFRFLNVPEELDQPGEYYLDRAAGKAYLWPPSAPKPGDLAISQLGEPLFRIKDAQKVVLSNLVLETGRDAAALIEGGEGVRMESCLIRGFGSDGVRIEGGKGHALVGCDFTEIGEAPVILSGGDRGTLTPAGHLVDDCRFWNYSRVCRTYRPAVALYGVGNRIVRCSFSDAPHSAIILSGNDHVIEGNDFRRVCLETGDAGAVYMGRDATMRGNIVRRNLFEEINPRVTTEGNFTDVMSVYLDDCWCGTLVEDNVFAGTGTGIMLGGGKDNVIRGNTFVNNHPAIHFDARGKGWAAKLFGKGGEWGFIEKIEAVKVDQPPYSRYPGLPEIWKTDLPFPTGNRIENNRAYDGAWIRYLDGVTAKDHGNTGNLVRKEVPSDWRKELSLGQMGVRTKTGRPGDRG